MSRPPKRHNDSSPQFKGLVEDISTQIDAWSADKAQEQKLEFVRRIIGQIRTFDRPKAPAFGKRPDTNEAALNRRREQALRELNTKGLLQK